MSSSSLFKRPNPSSKRLADRAQPVIVGAHELAVRTADAEPVTMMVAAARASLGETNNRLVPFIESVRIVKGIWPYKDPGRLVADELGLQGSTTALTAIGGNAAYDLVNETASEIAAGDLSVALICGAESMRTRRKDKREGRRSPYRDEAEGASPDTLWPDHELVNESDIAAGVASPVNFYAMAESVIRNERGETPVAHLERISELWAKGSDVASRNPHAWIRDAPNAQTIRTVSASNRMVAAPYTKLLTSNINVDQGAALVMCSYDIAREHGVTDDQMLFLLSGGGAYDELSLRARLHLHRSPAFDFAAQDTLDRAGVTIDTIDHLDLYSCFPASVQLAQASLGVPPGHNFTVTGGLTFAGGPFNGYCTQALAHVAGLLRGTEDTAFLYGNGGFFSKHSVLIVSGARPSTPFSYERSQAMVDAQPTRPLNPPGPGGTLEAYTVTYSRSNAPDRAICSVLDGTGSRHWAVTSSPADLQALSSSDRVGSDVLLSRADSQSVADDLPPHHSALRIAHLQ